MFDFILRVIITITLFIILFSTTHNMAPADVIRKMIDAAKQLWEYVSSHFSGDDSPYV